MEQRWHKMWPAGDHCSVPSLPQPSPFSFHKSKDSGPLKTRHDPPRARQRVLFSSADCQVECSLFLTPLMIWCKTSFEPFLLNNFFLLSPQESNHLTIIIKIINVGNYKAFSSPVHGLCSWLQRCSETKHPPSYSLFPPDPTFSLPSFSRSLRLWNCGPWPRNTSIIWGLVKNSEAQNFWMKIFILTRHSGDLYAH